MTADGSKVDLEGRRHHCDALPVAACLRRRSRRIVLRRTVYLPEHNSIGIRANDIYYEILLLAVKAPGEKKKFAHAGALVLPLRRTVSLYNPECGQAPPVTSSTIPCTARNGCLLP